MFMGEFSHSIDPKNRVIIPVKFRDELGENFVVTAGLDGCLYICPAEKWAQFVSELEKMPFTGKTRELTRFFLQNAAECELDKQGRALIPAKLKALAGLEKDVVFVGVNNKIELWNPDRLGGAVPKKPMEEITEELSSEYGLRF